MPRVAVFAGVLILMLTLFRVLRAIWLPELPNFSPIAALAFCGGLFLPGWIAWALPIGALVASDIVLSVMLGFSPLSGGQLIVWASIAGIVGIGRGLALCRDFSLPRFFGVLIGCAVAFYVVTNTGAWLMNPAYPRGIDGLWMSLTTGLPGYPPSWIFFRNSLVSDLLFGSLLLAVRVLVQVGELRQAREA
jgi:hypothetical protein